MVMMIMIHDDEDAAAADDDDDDDDGIALVWSMLRSGIQAQAIICQLNYFCTKKSAEKVLRKMRWNLEMCKKSEKMQKKVWQAVLVAGACLGWEYRECRKK